MCLHKWTIIVNCKMKDKTKQAGFSIIELLVVVIVIGILAAIVMLSYTGIQNGAHDSAVQSDLRQAADQIELFALDHNGDYAWSEATLSTADISATKNSYSTNQNSFLYCANNVGYSSPRFSLGATSKSGKIYYYSSMNERVQQITSGSLTCANMGFTPAWTTTGYSSGGGWQSWVK